MHEAVRDYVCQFGTLAPVSVLDIGGRDLNGRVSGFWPNARYTSLDLLPGKNVDIVADATCWDPVELTGFWDIVLCCEVFEHVEKWREIVRTAWLAVRDNGGRVIFTCAGEGRAPHSGIEATAITPGEYYGNVTADELRAAMEGVGFKDIECAQVGLDLQATAIG